MVTSSKILTVTYGTFSCTLEGFDDPFTTLQMVAEYFRKLAAEDRFFGSTPQTPDTDTLKRIAEENTSKGIDAELAEDGIILRQTEQPAELSEDDTKTSALIFDSIRNDGDDDVVPPAVDDFPVEPDAVTQEKDAAELATPLTFFRSRRGEPDDLSDDLEAAVEPVEEPSNDEDADARAIEAAISAAGLAGSATALRREEDENNTSEASTVSQKTVEETLAAIRQNVEQAESSIDAEIAEETAEVPVEEPQEETVEDLSEPLILGGEAAATEVEILVEEEPAEDAPVKETLAEEAEVPEPQIAEETIATAQDLTTETPAEAPSDDDWPFGTDTIAADEEATVEEDEEEDTRESSLTDEQEAELAADLEAAMLPEEALQEDVSDDDDLAQFEEAEEETSSEPDTTTTPSRAEILLNSGEAMEDGGALDRLLETTRSKMNKPEQVRRMNALEQLKAAVAATEADRQVRRKSVAATHSEAEDSDAADLAAYRDDLRRAQDSARLEGLKTTAPSAAPAPSSRPAAAQVQQSPLILVSEQRIDDTPEELAPTEPEPQREVAEIDGNLALKPEFTPNIEADLAPAVEAGEDGDDIQGIPADAFSDATSFSDFAERIGAFELTDLLEASAAYTSIVEERPRFSRAQVMSKLAKLNIGDAYTKEAGLRSFGKLLREGKILRVQDGQFAISKASRFSVASRYND